MCASAWKCESKLAHSFFNQLRLARKMVISHQEIFPSLVYPILLCCPKQVMLTLPWWEILAKPITVSITQRVFLTLLIFLLIFISSPCIFPFPWCHLWCSVIQSTQPIPTDSVTRLLCVLALLISLCGNSFRGVFLTFLNKRDMSNEKTWLEYLHPPNMTHFHAQLKTGNYNLWGSPWD